MTKEKGTKGQTTLCKRLMCLY